MSSREVCCAFCGQSLNVEAEPAQAITCPACGKIFAVPEGEKKADQPPAAKLRLRTEIGASGQQTVCPECGTGMPPHASFCVRCGFDRQTGIRRKSVSSDLPRLWWAFPAGALFIVAALLAIGFMLRGRDAGPARQTPAADSLPAVAADPAEPPSPDARETAPVAGPAQPRPMIPSFEETPDEREARLRANEQRHRARIERQLEADRPMWVEGEDVVLRRTSGQVVRGRFGGVSEDGVKLGITHGEITVPLDELDRDTRLRCDPEYRQRYIDYRVRQSLER